MKLKKQKQAFSCGIMSTPYISSQDTFCYRLLIDSEGEEGTNNPKSINLLLIYQYYLKFLFSETIFPKVVCAN